MLSLGFARSDADVCVGWGGDTVARACVAMRYPPSVRGMLFRENVPPLGLTGPFDIAHRDMHTNNIMLGDIDTRDREHTLTPRVKVSRTRMGGRNITGALRK